MKQSISPDARDRILDKLAPANLKFSAVYPGDRPDRQPIHTFYLAADQFEFDSALKLGASALRSIDKYAVTPEEFAQIFDIQDADLAAAVYDRTVRKLKTEPVEDIRIDFEDGFGNPTWEEEDRAAVHNAEQVAKAMNEGSLSPFSGIRIKPFTEDHKQRSVRTLDIFLSTLSHLTGGSLPDNFVVMLPKVTLPQQVKALVALFSEIESNSGIAENSLRCEMMVEATQAVIDAGGKNPLRKFIKAGKGRMIATAFGTYDYTASNNITARYQDMGHAVCDFAHFTMKASLGSTGVWLSDGATNVVPVEPHTAEDLNEQQAGENAEVIRATWKKTYDHVRHSLWKGLYQGWDLHPAQLPCRYAAVYTFYLESFKDAAHRMKAFMQGSAGATLTGQVFDDAATGQALMNYFLRGYNSGALNEDDVLESGLSLDELRSRSILKVLQGRK